MMEGLLSGLIPSAQHIANQNAASGRMLQSFRALIASVECKLGDPRRGNDERACPDQDSLQVLDDVGKSRVPGASPEKHPVISDRNRTGLMEELDQSAADVRVVSEAVVASDVALPDRQEPGGLGPKPEDVMIVIGQDEPATRSEGASHRPNHSERVRNVLEQVAGVHHVKRAPFFISKGEIEGIARPELDQVEFSCGEQPALVPRRAGQRRARFQ